ncbi:hypothetical protein [Nocardia paucivorans]|uniref:hypothetical protein n=1 Tax=Nocardia paucivorans TaxID=114259 RepID=UPI0002E54EB5|nr:hypothetical protein [Nocardia paucivorans]
MTAPTPGSEPEHRIGLDLVAPELYAPALRRLALAGLGVGIGAALLVGIVSGWSLGIPVGVAVGAPTAVYALALRRRRIWLSGTTLHARTLLRERVIPIAEATGAEILVYPARLSRIALRITAGPDSQIVPLAMYTDAGSGRELHLLGLRALADALTASPLAAALAVAEMLVGQLRAEARDAGLAERPLYRAVVLVRDRDYISPVVLTDAEVARLS